jgi:hypothetical protein
MAQQTADKSRKYKLNPDIRGELPVTASTTIYMNSAVGRNAGYARQLVAGDAFAGFAVGRVVNVADANRPGFTAGGVALGAAGALTVELRQDGIVEVTTIAGASAVTDVGTDVYMSDGDTFTLTTTSNTKVGKIAWYLNGVFGVRFQSDAAHFS